MLRPLFLSLVLSTTALWAAEPANTLTAEEKAGGWKLLFDGTSTKGWVVIGKGEAPAKGWVAEEGELRLKRGEDGKTPHTDIVTPDKYSDFELTWDWKISEGGNSGVKYNLPDANKNVGCEYQLIDDLKHKDASLHGGTRTTASLYDVIAAPADKAIKPAGEWNSSRVVVKGAHVEQFLNGKKTVEFDLGSPALKPLIEQSKFNKTPGWGEKTSSPILLQDHGDEVAFRNIKIHPGM